MWAYSTIIRNHFQKFQKFKVSNLFWWPKSMALNCLIESFTVEYWLCFVKLEIDPKILILHHTVLLSLPYWSLINWPFFTGCARHWPRSRISSSFCPKERGPIYGPTLCLSIDTHIRSKSRRKNSLDLALNWNWPREGHMSNQDIT